MLLPILRVFHLHLLWCANIINKNNNDDNYTSHNNGIVLRQSNELIQLSFFLINSLELVAAVREKDVAAGECEHLKRRTEALLTDCEQEKREKFETKVINDNVHDVLSRLVSLQLQNQLSELNDQLSQQADYCSSLGAASCTLLWRVSQREDCIHSILSGVSVYRSSLPHSEKSEV